MRIAFLAAEVAPYAKTGGLADVAGALPTALAAAGHDVAVLTPLHRVTRESRSGLRVALSELPVAGPEGAAPTRVLVDPGAAVPTYFIEQDAYFDRAGLYQEDGRGYGDNAARFAFYCRAALAAAAALGPAPDVFHLHDWHAALVPGLLRSWPLARAAFPKSATLLTIHNLAYQGSFPAGDVGPSGLPEALFRPDGYEFYGSLNFLKGGILLADKLSTVSSTYAREILRPEHGHGLDAVLRHRARDLVGVLNGIDTAAWNPADDPHIPANYGPDDPAGKEVCRRALLDEVAPGADARAPILAFVSRLVEQKGIDLVTDALDGLAQLGVRVVVHGDGDPANEERVARAAAARPDVLSARLRYDERFSRRVTAGADMILMPSRFEPCGLTQLYGMRYGAVPVVRETGGLRDSVEPFCPDTGSGTGFRFAEYDPRRLVETVRRALDCFRDRATWRRLVRNAMDVDFSWGVAAAQYDGLYAEAALGRLAAGS